MPETLNISPSFAREASQFLLEGSIQRATELCLQGVRTYPKYSTGYLVLGKCYEAIGKTPDALAAFRQALSILPDSPTLCDLVAKAVERESQEAQQRAEKERKKLEREEEKREEEKKNAEASSSPMNHPPVSLPTEGESTLEYLAKRLADVKRIKPNPDATPGITIPKSAPSANFVTPTMAEIYAGQGEYKEAINAYNELIRANPDEEKYKNRLEEIERLQKLEPPSNKKAS